MTIKIMTFSYTKENGRPTSRVFIPLHFPTDKYFGIDISELDVEDQALLANEVAEADSIYKSNISKIMKNYDVTNNYRYFIPQRMQDISSDEV